MNLQQLQLLAGAFRPAAAMQSLNWTSISLDSLRLFGSLAIGPQCAPSRSGSRRANSISGLPAAWHSD